MSKNKVTVTIANKDYTIMSSEPEEYLQKVAKHIDKKITEIVYSNSQLTINMATVLAAINVADEYFKSLEAADNLRQQVGQYIEDVSKDRAELASLRAENEHLLKELNRYRGESQYMSGQQSIL
ncbi:MAG: Cell division protein ZapA [Firmicutes bacterium ADurb.Bin193]|nr:MAG: Cell division protein ZapA [Firmicutes bacterium ADurb.Bin193]